MASMDLDRIKEDVLTECKDGYVELWSIIWMIRYALNGNAYPVEDASDPLEVRKSTMDLVRTVLQTGKVVVGSLSDQGDSFEPWSMTTEQALARIDSDWEALGHEPDMENAIAIFTAVKR